MHLTLRVAWHDNKWNGTVCHAPSQNPFCLALDRIRAGRNDQVEDRNHDVAFADLPSNAQPPCKAEAGAFMNERQWVRVFNHPYKDLSKTHATHGRLEATPFSVPPYTTFGVPFWWMLSENQNEIDAAQPDPLPPEEASPFNNTAFIFGRARQEAIAQLFFKQLQPETSLVMFYCKEGQPLGDEISRLVIGVGRILQLGRLWYYQIEDKAKPSYPIWDRLIYHSIRPEKSDGFLLPYHDYLRPTGDPEEDGRRAGLLKEIAVSVPSEHIRTFSYMSELATADVALSILARCLHAVAKIKEHGIAPGPWDEREDWLNTQIARLWQERGAFPGVGSALEAVGLQLGTALFLELVSTGRLKAEENPWPLLDAILCGQEPCPRPAYQGDVDAIKNTWNTLPEARRNLLQLLSRFALSPDQVKRWFDPAKRPGPIKDAELLANPYQIAEADLGDAATEAISVGAIDRGLLPDPTIAARHPVRPPSAVQSNLDARRVRAALVSVLRAAAVQGDSLISEREALARMGSLDLAHPCEITSDWVQANLEFLSGTVERMTVLPQKDAQDLQDEERQIPALQLTDLKSQEDWLRKLLLARAAKTLPSAGVDWKSLLRGAIGDRFHPDDPRHEAALEEQAAALERVTTRKLSVLTGRAGTGKTSTLGALLLCEPLQTGGILLLAPTGKARVMLGSAAGSEAMTIAQFLYSLKRYDGERQRPLFEGKDKYHKEKTVVIDESSMVTMDNLYAVFQALDLVHVQRIILVGDPNQLPPIGVGRPFADLCAHLEAAAQSKDAEEQVLAGALGRLTVEVRMVSPEKQAPEIQDRKEEKERSDTLRLAAWFTRETQPADADAIFDKLESGETLNDLDVQFWSSPDDLQRLLFEMFNKHLGIAGPNDVAGFNKALGLNDKGWVPYDDPTGAEKFQILSPVRMHPYGIYELNRMIQLRFRSKELEEARRGHKVKLGEEEIVIRDKVIQVWNERRSAFENKVKKKDYIYLANGEIGICAREQFPFMNVVFAGRPWYTVGYAGWDFPAGAGPLQLAYALTVHKAQGSQFFKTFVVLPKNCRLLTRELLYTALTRSREKLILLIEGNTRDFTMLYRFSQPESSEVVQRNTNLFWPVVRARADTVPYAEYLIHRAQKGHMVRSKSELVVANTLYSLGIPYLYEPRFEGRLKPGVRRPDFMFADPSGEPIIWEHLGMMSRPDYQASWTEKAKWYGENGFVLGENLFTTEDDDRGGLDSTQVLETAKKIQAML